MGVQIKLYKTERDFGTGRLDKGLSFVRQQHQRIHDATTGLVSGDVMDGGFHGILVAPEGSELIELESGDTALNVPGMGGISAAEAWTMAMRREHGFGRP
jgi:hypothetical protein